MTGVSKSWIRDNVKHLHGFGGQYDKERVLEEIKVPKGGFETTLTKSGKEEVERGERCGKFLILLPYGLGWADAYGYGYNNEEEYLD